MGKKKIAKRSKIKAFVKVFNYNHLMPTRYVYSEQTEGLCAYSFCIRIDRCFHSKADDTLGNFSSYVAGQLLEMLLSTGNQVWDADPRLI